jgi:hypothetical protein
MALPKPRPAPVTIAVPLDVALSIAAPRLRKMSRATQRYQKRRPRKQQIIFSTTLCTPGTTPRTLLRHTAHTPHTTPAPPNLTSHRATTPGTSGSTTPRNCIRDAKLNHTEQLHRPNHTTHQHHVPAPATSASPHLATAPATSGSTTPRNGVATRASAKTLAPQCNRFERSWPRGDAASQFFCERVHSEAHRK